MVREANIAAIEKATGKSWDEWLTFFESINAKDLDHKQIAQKVHEAGTPGWWSQAVTVAYEQHIGRRKPGQVKDGSFAVTVSKTFNGTMDEAIDAWVDLTASQKDFNGVAIAQNPEVTQSDKWRYWHCGLEDGSRVTVGIYQKIPDKAAFGLGHEKLASASDVEKWRTFWKEYIQF